MYNILIFVIILCEMGHPRKLKKLKTIDRKTISNAPFLSLHHTEAGITLFLLSVNHEGRYGPTGKDCQLLKAGEALLSKPWLLMKPNITGLLKWNPDFRWSHLFPRNKSHLPLLN